MKVFWRRAKPFVWGVFCVLLALYLSPLSAQINYAIATHEKIPLLSQLFKYDLILVMVIWGMFVVFAAFCIAIGAAITAYGEHENLTPKFYYAVLFCTFYTAGWMGMGIGWPTRRAGLQRAATRAQPLIVAIKKFRLENKRAPHNLQELVPIYLSKIPQTGMTAYPRFDYSAHEEHKRRTPFKTYEIKVRTSARFSNWDTFNYWPEGDYPTEMYGGRVERIGAWAYVHE